MSVPAAISVWRGYPILHQMTCWLQIKSVLCGAQSVFSQSGKAISCTTCHDPHNDATEIAERLMHASTVTPQARNRTLRCAP